ncbi:MAG: 4-alpha-glucanotransferase [Acidimicrobiia bacterium]|nr:4-alpha-glucanotransferase [Acidimicrobiia bacterium]
MGVDPRCDSCREKLQKPEHTRVHLSAGCESGQNRIMQLTRSSGILLHPTSLPGRYGIGDLGPAAHDWIEALAETGTGLWQLLPLGPTGYGDSPYQCFSAFAGNPYLVSPDLLLTDGLLIAADLAELPDLRNEAVDYGTVIPFKLGLLDRAFARSSDLDLEDDLQRFRERHAGWLTDFGLFMALKDIHDGEPWWTWEADLRDRKQAALDRTRSRYTDLIHRHIFRQFLFFRQWEQIREKAARCNVRIIGDLPIFVAEDSADVWSHRHLFALDDEGRPTVIAGVPPDYFSPTGQLWGNPLYRWEVHKETGYAWWLDRLRAVLDLVDVVRLDHFRGFAAYWEVPGGEDTAETGRWVEGPGAGFLEAVAAEFGQPPIIAEDLGEITPDVIELRDRFELPGMKILQFAFDSGETNDFLPHRYPEHCVVYTGTHDNDTTRGWFESAGDDDKAFALEYLGVDGQNYAWDLIRAAWESRAAWAVTTMQDVLDLGTEARMNFPSVPAGNWRWRMTEGSFSPELRARFRQLNETAGRSASGD